jgi:hypothetical protein
MGEVRGPRVEEAADPPHSHFSTAHRQTQTRTAQSRRPSSTMRSARQARSVRRTADHASHFVSEGIFERGERILWPHENDSRHFWRVPLAVWCHRERRPARRLLCVGRGRSAASLYPGAPSPRRGSR